MSRSRAFRFAALFGYLLCLGLSPSSASSTGVLTFSCTIHFAIVPTSTGPSADCNGSANGSLVVRSPTVNAVLLARNAPFQWHFNRYSDICVGNLIAVSSSAPGNVRISQLSVGTSNTTAIITQSAVWRRLLLEMDGDFYGGVVTFSSGQEALPSHGRVEGTFQPLGTSVPYQCTNPAPLDARMRGVVVSV
jgi:hypothetical protein